MFSKRMSFKLAAITRMSHQLFSKDTLRKLNFVSLSTCFEALPTEKKQKKTRTVTPGSQREKLKTVFKKFESFCRRECATNCVNVTNRPRSTHRNSAASSCREPFEHAVTGIGYIHIGSDTMAGFQAYGFMTECTEE